MNVNPPSDSEVGDWLTTMGVATLCQWDVLVFLYRHQATLVGADYVARLLGYATEPVVAALDALDSRGLLARSRVSQGARLYQFTAPSEPPSGKAFEELLDLTKNRAGRLRLSKQLQRNDRVPPAGAEASRRLRGEAAPSVRANEQRSHGRDQGRRIWRKAI